MTGGGRGGRREAGVGRRKPAQRRLDPIPDPRPTVSVIIPTWNRAAMLRLTLATALAQDVSDIEVLVIGDGCTDESETVVASFGDARLRWHNLPQNSGGPSIPNNTGLRLARGRYVAHLGHDDFWLPWHLSGLLKTLDDSGADWAYSLVVAVGPEGIRHCSGPPQPGVPDAEHHVPPSGWLYRREVAELVGDWADPEALAWPVDFDVMRRAALAGVCFACSTRPTALKFPSSLFPDGYRSGEPAPIQQEAFARIQRDPLGLEFGILRDLATRFAQLDRGSGKGVFDRGRAGAAATRRDAREERRQFQERRRGRLHLRGLAPDSVAAEEAPAPRSDAGVAHDRLAVRQVRRERRQRRRQRNAFIQARRERREQRAEGDERSNAERDLETAGGAD